MRFRKFLLSAAFLAIAAACAVEEPVSETEEPGAPPPEAPEVVVSTTDETARPYNVEPWLVEIRPNGYATWNLNQVEGLDHASFDEKAGEREFPKECDRQGTSQVYRCGRFTVHPTEPGKVESYKILLHFGNNTTETIDPDYRVGPHGLLPSPQSPIQQPQ